MAKRIAVPQVNGSTAANVITIAEGTEYAREHKLKILRGKQYRDKHLKLLETFGELEAVSRVSEGGSQFKAVIEAIQKLFTIESFEAEMLPFALGMETDEEKKYLEDLLPLEQFMAYMQGAAYIVNGASSDGVQAALKK
jgi:hypothetical protein